MHYLLRGIVYSSFWVALVIASLTWMGQWWFKSYDTLRLVLVFLIAFSGYNFIRIFGGYLHKFSSESDRQSWIYHHRKSLALAAALAAMVSAYLVVIDGLYTQPGIYLAPTLTLAYSLPIWKNRFRLRDVPFIKVFVIALVWVSVICFIGIEGYELKGLQALFFAQLFFYILAMTIPFDIRDINRDPSHLKTIPQWAGIKPAKRIAQACLILFEVGLWLQLVIFKNLKLLPFIVIMISNKALLGLIYWSEEDRDEMYYSFWIEGAPLLAVGGIVFWELIR